MERHADTLRRRADGEDIGDLACAAAARRRAALQMSMSERLARVHALCKQMGAVRGAARVAVSPAGDEAGTGPRAGSR